MSQYCRDTLDSMSDLRHSSVMAADLASTDLIDNDLIDNDLTGAAATSTVGAGTCYTCGTANSVIDRFQDYSTTRGPMVEHLVTKCPNCGRRDVHHHAAHAVGPIS